MRLAGRTILVTGATGFIGLNLLPALKHEGATIIAASRADVPGVRTLRWDMLDDTIDIPAEVDTVVHLAGLSSPQRSKDTALTQRINVDATKTLLAAAQHVRRFIFTSSSLAYAPTATLPLTEDAPLDETCTEPYVASKIAGEQLCDASGVPTLIYRFANGYGPHQQWEGTPTLIPLMIAQALREKRISIRNGSPVRDWLYVGDLVEAIVRGIAANLTGTYNVGTAKGTSTHDVAATIGKLLNVPFTDEKAPVHGLRDIILDTSLLRLKLHWTPSTSVEEGLKKSVDWYQENVPLD